MLPSYCNMCLGIGTPKSINFSFVPNGKLMVSGAPVLKHMKGIYSRTSMARTLMARLPRLFRTCSSVPRKTNPWLQIWANLV